ncbi:MAG TPA: SGNH/GDSL hydrolase family protein [Candidatus Nanopelagicaceae bacterium]|nr:SGNH/GDSL hydrolase family protein [Candidatus Nanopelagicaceae bacterium]
MTKTILFIGDSITEGKIGIGYVDIIQHYFPEFQCKNYGRGGDTLSGIVTRLLKILKTHTEKYDIIVIEAGHNDLFLPYLKKKWNFTSTRKVAPLNKIKDFYDNGLRAISLHSKAKIIITTLSCLGEDVSSSLNQKRRLVNDQIKEVGSKHGAYIADVSPLFDKILRKCNSSNYLMDNPLNLVFDYFRSKRMNWAESISRKRRLVLTIDGGHLNSKGAIIYAREISRILDML